MKDDLCFPDSVRIGQEILAYLAEHPDAEDTLDGIMEWWLLERKIKHQARLVRDAVSDLVQKGQLVASGGTGSAVLYKLNTKKQGEGRT